jgi:hypothetical protein
MEYTKRKKELLESLLKEREAGFKELLSGDSILMPTASLNQGFISMEDQQPEDETEKLIKEILKSKKS